MPLDPLSLATTIIGGALVFIGGFFDLVAAIGVNRFPDLYTRLHAVTIGAIGGAVYPIIGAALLAYSLTRDPWTAAAYAAPLLVTALLIAVTAPTGSHAVARAAYRSGHKPRLGEGGEQC